MINQCLLNRYIISYEPYMFKGMLSDYPDTVDYGQKMDALRTDLREYFLGRQVLRRAGRFRTAWRRGTLDSYAVYQNAGGRQGWSSATTMRKIRLCTAQPGERPEAEPVPSG